MIEIMFTVIRIIRYTINYIILIILLLLLVFLSFSLWLSFFIININM